MRKGKQKLAAAQTVTCPICSGQYRCINGHVRVHGITVAQFRQQYPDAPLQSDAFVAQAAESRNKKLRNRSSSYRKRFSAKMAETMRRRYSTMSDAERTAWSARSRTNMQTFIASMTPDELAAYRKRASEKARSQDLTAFRAGGRVAWHRWNASMTDDERRAHRETLSAAHKQRFANMTEQELQAHIRRTGGRDTSGPEQQAVECLEAMGLTVEPKRKFGRHEVDAYLPDLGVVVEIDGDYWHGSPRLFADDGVHPTTGQSISAIRERDARRTKCIEAKGVKVIRVWESDLEDHGYVNVLRAAIYGNTEPSPIGNGREGVTTEARGYGADSTMPVMGRPHRITDAGERGAPVRVKR